VRRPIAVLVADDSRAARRTLAALLAEAPDLEVVGEAADGEEAVRLAQKLRPDVVTVDVQMPGMNGIEATAAIMAEAPCRVVVVCAVSQREAVDLSFRAMAAGALEVIAKPAPGEDTRAWGRRAVESVRLMAEIPVVTRQRKVRSTFHPGASRRVDAFGLVASTGGPAALARILGALPEDLPIPLFVAQHIMPGFGTGLVRWLRSESRIDVRIAAEGEAARPAAAYFPPDGRDLTVDEDGLLRLPRCSGSCHPSGDRLLESLAAAYGSRAGGAVLTGMGADGAQGLARVKRAGGLTLAQDAGTSVVFGMARAAREAGAVGDVVPLDGIAPAIVGAARR
jgi:two-component system, chemotaxis family, protein-glutamate methylesterase/glutaminase